METGKPEQTGVNKGGTVLKFGTKLTRACSRPVRYRLIDADGFAWGTFGSIRTAAAEAERLWPGTPQDEDRMGFGWDVEVVNF